MNPKITPISVWLMYIYRCNLNEVNNKYSSSLSLVCHGIRATQKLKLGCAFFDERNMVDGKDVVSSSSVTVEGGMSPYYLAPSDNPGTAITPVILNGEKYAEWASEFENALRAKRKIGFLNGSLKIQDEKEKPVEAEMWRKANSMIVGWIKASILPVIRSTMSFSPDAYKMWTELRKCFSVGSTVCVHQLKAELASCKQSGSSIMDYFGRLSQKWEELLNCKPIPTSTCNASEIYAKEYKE